MKIRRSLRLIYSFRLVVVVLVVVVFSHLRQVASPLPADDAVNRDDTSAAGTCTTCYNFISSASLVGSFGSLISIITFSRLPNYGIMEFRHGIGFGEPFGDE